MRNMGKDIPLQSNKLLAIGLDAGDLYFIQSRLDHLPNLAKLVARSQIFRPASPVSLSGSVWPTFYTGSEPGHHGIYQHLLWNPQRMGLKRIDSAWCRRTPFWKTLDEKGLRSIVVDVPYCFSNQLSNSVEILDWGTHGQTMPVAANSSEVLDFVRKFGPSPIGRETPIRKSDKELERIRSVVKQSAARKADLILELMENFEWDLCLPVFGETHRAGHIFYSDQDLPQANDVESPLLDAYRAVDTAIGRVMNAVDPETTSVMIFSVHGMMPDNNQSGLVTQVIDRINKKFMAEHFGLAPIEKPEKSKSRPSRGLVNRLRGMIPDSLQLAVAKASPDFFRSWVVEQEIVGGINWSRTPGFALRTDIRSEVRLNLKGREKLGILEPGSDQHKAYDALLHDVFLSLEDAERNHKLVDEVVSIRSLFPGEHAEMLPDYVVRWKTLPLATHVRSPYIEDIHMELYGVRGGDHRDEGFILLDNKNSCADVTPPEAISDIAHLIENVVGASDPVPHAESSIHVASARA